MNHRPRHVFELIGFQEPGFRYPCKCRLAVVERIDIHEALALVALPRYIARHLERKSRVETLGASRKQTERVEYARAAGVCLS